MNKFLIQKSEEAGVKIYFGHALDVSETSFTDGAINAGGGVGSRLCFEVEENGTKSKRYVNCACPVLGCDGGGSRVRYAMKMQGLTDFTETLLGIEM